MRKIIIFFTVFFLFCGQAWATTYGPTSIAAGDDDCDEKNDTTIELSGIDSDGDLIGHYFSSYYDTAWRWDNVTVPNGVTIETGTKITVNGSYELGDSFVGIIKGIKEADPGDWNAGTRPSQRTKTTATVAYSPSLATWDSGGDNDTPELKTIIQEIVDQGTYASGNAMAFVWEDNGSTNGHIRQMGDKTNGANTPATLTIVYTVGGVTRRVIFTQ